MMEWQTSETGDPLVESRQVHQPSAEEALVALAPEVVNFLEHHVGDPVLAADIAQDTLAQAFQLLGTLRDIRALRAWVFRIAVNRFNDHLRRVRRAPAVEELQDVVERPDHDRPEHSVMRRELDDVIRSSVAQLPERQRTVFLLHDAKGMSHPEIAALLNITTDAVKTSLFHAREKLRERLNRYLGRRGND